MGSFRILGVFAAAILLATGCSNPGAGTAAPTAPAPSPTLTPSPEPTQQGVAEDGSCGSASGAAPALTYTPEQGEDIQAKFNTMILDYLTARGSTEGLDAALSGAASEPPRIDAQVIRANITGGPAAEALVGVNVSWGSGYQYILNVYACQGNRFVQSDSLEINQAGEISAAPNVTIVAVEDLNKNQRPEIVLRDNAVGQKMSEEVSLYEWDGKRLVQVFTTDYFLGLLGTVEADRANGGEVRFTRHFAYGEMDHSPIELILSRPERETIRWDGNAFEIACRIFTDTPSTLFETFHSAEAYRACGDYEQAATFYRRMIDEKSLKRWDEYQMLAFPPGTDTPSEYAAFAQQQEQSYLIPFAGYRLVQIDLNSGDLDGAKAVFEQVESSYKTGQQGHLYAAMAAALIADYEQSKDLASACQAASKSMADTRQSKADPGIPYYESEMAQNRPRGFYFSSGIIYSSDPDDVFSIPESITPMVSIPVCLSD